MGFGALGFQLGCAHLRKSLAGLDERTAVDVDAIDKARNLGVNVDGLVGPQFAEDDGRLLKRLRGDLRQLGPHSDAVLGDNRENTSPS